MRRCISAILLAAMLLSAGLFDVSCAARSGGTLPDALRVDPSPDNGLPCSLQLVRTEEEYTLYLPGNADPEACRLSWEGGLPAYDGNGYRESGEMPVPLPGETAVYTFRNDAGEARFTVTTMQGSKDVQPVFFEIDERKGTIGEMDGDPDHNASCSGAVFIGGEKHVLRRIKGRGNWTWTAAVEKKSYNVVLGEKCEIPGLDAGETDRYSFLSNVGDHSLLRNRVGYDLGYALGIGYGSVNADVWMNGVYRGLYLVAPKTDAYVSDDGYLLENDCYCEPPVFEGGDPSFTLEGLFGSGGTDLTDNTDNRITIKKIGVRLIAGTDGQKAGSEGELLGAEEEIRAWMQEMWDAVRSPDGYNGKGKYYTEYIDPTSFAKMFLILEYSKDFDACCGSKFFQRFGTGGGDRLYAMPVWDLDNAFGTQRINARLLLGDDLVQPTGYGEYFRNMRDLQTSIYRKLGTHADFMEETVRVYREYKALFDSIPEKVDAFAAEIEDSARMNFHKTGPVEKANLDSYRKDTVRNAGTEYEQFYVAAKDPRSDWPAYVRNLRTFCETRSRFIRDHMENGSYAEPLPETTPHTFLFTDVRDREKYYYEAVYWAAYHIPPISSGTEEGKFGPDLACTKGQGLVFLYNAAGRQGTGDRRSGTSGKTYTDVQIKTMYWDAVRWGMDEGIVSPKSETVFGIGDALTRADFLTMLYRYAGSPDGGTDTQPSDAVAWAERKGITAGMEEEGRFDPDAVCTRAEVMTFLYRLTGER